MPSEGRGGGDRGAPPTPKFACLGQRSLRDCFLLSLSLRMVELKFGTRQVQPGSVSLSFRTRLLFLASALLGGEEHLPTVGLETPGEGSKRTSAFLHPSPHPQPRWWPALCRSCGVAVPLWLQLPPGKLGEVGGVTLKGPRWQQRPVKPASWPQPPLRSSPEAWIPPVFSPSPCLGIPAPFGAPVSPPGGGRQKAESTKRLGRC